MLPGISHGHRIGGASRYPDRVGEKKIYVEAAARGNE